MENLGSSCEADGLPVYGAPWRPPAPLPLPADFFPLRLVLQPSGAAVELRQPDMLIGRHSQADVRLPLPDVSRRHCRFFFSQGEWHAVDLNSLNGVFLNGEPIRQFVVHSGDLIRIGGFTFAVEVMEGGAETDQSKAPEGLIRGLFKRVPDAESRRRAS